MRWAATSLHLVWHIARFICLNKNLDCKISTARSLLSLPCSLSPSSPAPPWPPPTPPWPPPAAASASYMATSASSLAAVACSSTAPTASAVEGTASTSSVAVAPPLLRSPSAAAGRPPRCGGDLLFRALQGQQQFGLPNVAATSRGQTWPASKRGAVVPSGCLVPSVCALLGFSQQGSQSARPLIPSVYPFAKCILTSVPYGYLTCCTSVLLSSFFPV
jgi:hypothetical protein